MQNDNKPKYANGGALPSSSSMTAKDVGLADIIAIIRRRKTLVMTVILGITLLTGVILFLVTPRYTAETLLMIESRSINIANLRNVVSGLSINAETIEGEIEVLRSRALAEKVIDSLNLYNDHEFGDGPASTNGEIDERLRSNVINAFQKKLDVSQKGRSRVISVAFTSEDPLKAAKIANKIADVYLIEQMEAKYDATRRVEEWLSQRVASLRQKVEESEAAVERFRQKTGLLQGKETSLTSQQLTELNAQLILAKAARAEAEARYKQTRRLHNAEGGIESSGEVLGSMLIQNLRKQEADIQRKLAELRTEYGERHPKMINLRAEARSLKNKIKSEIAKIAKGLENEVAIARARELSLKKSIDALNKQIAASSDDMIQLHALEREAEANRTLLKTLLSRMKEASNQDDKNIQLADARIVSKAKMPGRPSFPKKLPIIALAIIGSAIIGLLLAFLFEYLDQGFRSGDEIEQFTGMTSLGFVPLINKAKMKIISPKSYLMEHPKSAFGESINTLRWSINLPYPDRPPQIILFTSTQPKEGKTTVAMGLAIMSSRAGKRVVLIDADCRMPRVDKELGLQTTPGLTEVLSAELTFQEVIQRDADTNIDIIAAGKIVPDPGDILASKQMDDLLEYLRERYDVIIIDSPPVMVASDAMILSKKVDTSVFIVRWSDTKREAVRNALKKLKASGATFAGVLLTLVDVEKHSLYNYGDSGYYSGRLKNYYAE